MRTRKRCLGRAFWATKSRPVVCARPQPPMPRGQTLFRAYLSRLSPLGGARGGLFVVPYPQLSIPLFSVRCLGFPCSIVFPPSLAAVPSAHVIHAVCRLLTVSITCIGLGRRPREGPAWERRREPASEASGVAADLPCGPRHGVSEHVWGRVHQEHDTCGAARRVGVCGEPLREGVFLSLLFCFFVSSFSLVRSWFYFCFIFPALVSG